MGSYSASEFLEEWYDMTGKNFASPVSILQSDKTLAEAFVVAIHKFEFHHHKWLRDNIQKHSFLSGLRPNEWWED